MKKFLILFTAMNLLSLGAKADDASDKITRLGDQLVQIKAGQDGTKERPKFKTAFNVWKAEIDNAANPQDIHRAQLKAISKLEYQINKSVRDFKPAMDLLTDLSTSPDAYVAAEATRVGIWVNDKKQQFFKIPFPLSDKDRLGLTQLVVDIKTKHDACVAETETAPDALRVRVTTALTHWTKKQSEANDSVVALTAKENDLKTQLANQTTKLNELSLKVANFVVTGDSSTEDGRAEVAKQEEQKAILDREFLKEKKQKATWETELSTASGSLANARNEHSSATKALDLVNLLQTKNNEHQTFCRTTLKTTKEKFVNDKSLDFSKFPGKKPLDPARNAVSEFGATHTVLSDHKPEIDADTNKAIEAAHPVK